MGLYTDITHFILELVQNADDNTYLSNSTATLKLRLSRDEIVVECNEVGFNERDVNAITQINASTKKGRKSVNEGYIGEKGIGLISPPSPLRQGISAQKLIAYF